MSSPYANGTAWIDGGFVPIAEARIPLTDWGFLRSDATYDVVATSKGRFFRLDRHLDRFHASVDKLRMTLPVARDELAHILAECVGRTGIEDAYVSMTCTRGTPPPGPRDPRRFTNRLYCFAIPYVWVFNARDKGRAAKLITASTERIPPESVDPRVKNYHWLDLVMGVFEALDSGADLPILIDREGNVTEGSGFNIFMVEKGRVLTPAKGVLEGITRETVLDICQREQIDSSQAHFGIERLRKADEVFLTSTAGGIMPVGEIDKMQIGAGGMGPITQRVHDTYWAWHADPAQTTSVRSLLEPRRMAGR
jgi:branched-chain amino acid aminotransferase